MGAARTGSAGALISAGRCAQIPSLEALRIGQCDISHFSRLSATFVNHRSQLTLPQSGALSCKVPGSCKLYTKAEAKANPRNPLGNPRETAQSRSTSTMPRSGRFQSAQFGGVGGARKGRFELSPSLRAHSFIMGCDRECGVRPRHPFPQRHRAADDHEELVGVGDLVRHHELEVHPEELPAEAVVILRHDHVAEADRHDGRVAAGRTDIDAVAFNGSKSKKFITSLRAWQSIQSTDGSVAIMRRWSRKNFAALW